MCTQTHACMCMLMHIHAHTHMHTWTLTHTHTHAHTQGKSTSFTDFLKFDAKHLVPRAFRHKLDSISKPLFPLCLHPCSLDLSFSEKWAYESSSKVLEEV